jgi:16S rRNA C967 or C1407 C5-methylase (RsmB/RsmF family)
MSELSRLAHKVIHALFSEQEEGRAQLEDALTRGERETQAVLWLNEMVRDAFTSTPTTPSWFPPYVQCISADERPGKHQLHDQGAIYCLDSSSVFCGSVVHALGLKPERVLDLCASPGGKALLTWRATRPEILIANETIGKRLPALIANLKRCSIAPVYVTSMDSRVYAERTQAVMDLVLVDAPCSGQSLLARGIESPGCFHPATINMNANRQKRILSNAFATVAPGGYLVYMTCTYALQENERVLEWFIKRNQDVTVVEVPGYHSFTSRYTQLPCYRIFPWQGGAGGFVAVMQRAQSGERQEFIEDDLSIAWRHD